MKKLTPHVRTKKYKKFKRRTGKKCPANNFLKLIIISIIKLRITIFNYDPIIYEIKPTTFNLYKNIFNEVVKLQNNYFIIRNAFNNSKFWSLLQYGTPR